jgi:hypothetical protein
MAEFIPDEQALTSLKGKNVVMTGYGSVFSPPQRLLKIFPELQPV